MSVIAEPISTQAFELIRDRIGVILADELPVQADLKYDTDLDATVYAERFIPFDKTELPAVNVSLARGLISGQTTIRSDGTHTYYIDVHTSAKSDDGSNGDQKAMLRLHKMLGVCRAILEDARYLTLGFQKPFIMNRHVEEIGIAEPDRSDATSAVMGRIILSVKATETINLVIPNLIAGYETNVKLSLTDKGYIFSESP